MIETVDMTAWTSADGLRFTPSAPWHHPGEIQLCNECKDDVPAVAEVGMSSDQEPLDLFSLCAVHLKALRAVKTPG